MPVIYQGYVDPSKPEEAAEAVMMTDKNVGPLLVLWLTLTTNPTFRPTSTSPGLSPEDRATFAAKLDVTEYFVNAVFQKFVDAYVNTEASVMSNLFHALAAHSGYVGPDCPSVIDPIVALGGN